MTGFVHTHFPSDHPGVSRATQVAEAAGRIARGFDGARGLASLLLAAVVASLLVAANEVMDTWSDGHLLMAWIAMWIWVFAALALFAKPARAAARRLSAGLKAWTASRQQAAADEKLWDLALRDARVMAEISRAMSQEASRDIRSYY